MVAPDLFPLAESRSPGSSKIALDPDAGSLGYPVRRGTVLGLPLPRVLLPRSDTRESGDGAAARFDVAIALPGIGEVVRYQGILSPASASPDLVPGRPEAVRPPDGPPLPGRMAGAPPEVDRAQPGPALPSLASRPALDRR